VPAKELDLLYGVLKASNWNSKWHQVQTLWRNENLPGNGPDFVQIDFFSSYLFWCL